jgi:hypothetical protein
MSDCRPLGKRCAKAVGTCDAGRALRTGDFWMVPCADCAGQNVAQQGASMYWCDRQEAVRISYYVQHGDGVGSIEIPRKGVLLFVNGLHGLG